MLSIFAAIVCFLLEFICNAVVFSKKTVRRIPFNSALRFFYDLAFYSSLNIFSATATATPKRANMILSICSGLLSMQENRAESIAGSALQV